MLSDKGLSDLNAKKDHVIFPIVFYGMNYGNKDNQRDDTHFDTEVRMLPYQLFGMMGENFR